MCVCLVHKELEGSSLGVVFSFFFFFLVGVGLGFCFGRGLGGGQHWELKGGDGEFACTCSNFYALKAYSKTCPSRESVCNHYKAFWHADFCLRSR